MNEMIVVSFESASILSKLDDRFELRHCLPMGRSRTEDVFDRLRGEILVGALTPGQRLIFPELCTRYESSVGALREALTRLTEHGLVAFEQNFGFRVISLSQAGLVELSDARAELEALVVRLAVSEGSLEWEAGLVAAAHRLKNTPFSAQWHEVHADFHLALLGGCGNRHLLAAAERLREQAELYRRWSKDDSRRDETAHLQIANAAVARDVKKTELLVRKHISMTRNSRLTLPDLL